MWAATRRTACQTASNLRKHNCGPGYPGLTEDSIHQKEAHLMTMTIEQAEWFAGTFEKLVANVGLAVLGK